MQKNVQRHLAYITLPLVVGLLGLILFGGFHGLRARRVGFPIHVASNTCFCGDRDDLVIFLHISAGGLSINAEKVDPKSLAGRLSDIYRTRAEKVLYLSVDDDVSFQVVADVVGTVQHLPEGTLLAVPSPQGLTRAGAQFERFSRVGDTACGRCTLPRELFQFGEAGIPG